MRKLAFAVTLLMISGSMALGQDDKATGIDIGHPWAAPTSGSQQSGDVYMSLANRAPRPTG